MSISAMKQALEALALVASSDEWLGCQTYEGQIATSAYEALRQAIAKAEKQEAVAWMWKDGTLTSDPDVADGTWTPLFTAPVHASDISQECVDETAKDRHEPVAWWDGKESVVFAHDTIYTPNWTDYWTKPLYADPNPCKTCEALSMSVMADHVYHEQVCPKKEWVGLTDEEYEHFSFYADWEAVDAIVAKLKEKNA